MRRTTNPLRIRVAFSRSSLGLSGEGNPRFCAAIKCRIPPNTWTRGQDAGLDPQMLQNTFCPRYNDIIYSSKETLRASVHTKDMGHTKVPYEGSGKKKGSYISV